MTSKKPFVKWVLNGTELRLHQNLIYWPSPTTSLEQYPRVIWVAASLAAVLILPPVKLNSSQVVHLYFGRHPQGEAFISLLNESWVLHRRLFVCVFQWWDPAYSSPPTASLTLFLRHKRKRWPIPPWTHEHTFSKPFLQEVRHIWSTICEAKGCLPLISLVPLGKPERC